MVEPPKKRQEKKVKKPKKTEKDKSNLSEGTEPEALSGGGIPDVDFKKLLGCG